VEILFEDGAKWDGRVSEAAGGISEG